MSYLARRLSGLFCAFFLSQSAAFADTISATDPQSLAAKLQEYGFRAELSTDTQGDPKIDTAASGISYSIFFYNCEDGANCLDLLFSAGFTFSNGYDGEDMADWNYQKLMGRAYLDKDGDPVVEHYIAGARALASEDFARTVDQWERMLDQFKEHIGW